MIFSPFSTYAHPVPCGGTAAGETITPVSEAEARQWARDHLPEDQYPALFDAPDAALTHVAAYLPADLLSRLDAEKAASGRSRSDILIAALRQYLPRA